MALEDKFRVLVVDDDPLIRTLLDSFLNKRGYEVAQAEKGYQSLDMIRENPRGYDVVILDVMLTDSNGINDILPRIKEADSLLPVIILTGRGDEDIAAKAMGTGAVYYMAKPFRFDELDLILKRLITPLPDLGELKVIKFGGSFDDQDSQTPRHICNFQYAVQILEELHSHGRRAIGTTGAGQGGERAKKFRAKYGGVGTVKEEFHLMIRRALELNATMISRLFTKGRYFAPEDFYLITKEVIDSLIPFLVVPPSHISRHYGLQMDQSDLLTYRIAEFFGGDIILWKRTDGFYKFDPLRGYTINPATGRCADYGAWKRAQKGNERCEQVTVDLVIEHMSREGTSIETGLADGTADHLFETSALNDFNKGSKVNYVFLAPAAPEEMYMPTSSGRAVHVITGQEIDMPDPRDERAYPQFVYGMIKQGIVAAFNGTGPRITKS